MKIEFDDEKRRLTFELRGLDFAQAEDVFDGTEYTWEDDRSDYGEQRYNTFGTLSSRLVSVTWTVRNGNRRIISMRNANEREQARYRRTMD